MLVRRFGNRLVPLALIGFGAITIGTGFIHTRCQFYAVKSLLGIAESFVLPGNSYIIKQFYKRSELSVRIGFFIFSVGCLSGAFGGLLASGFLHLAPIGQVHTWRHIFVWEGLIMMALGLILFFLYPHRVETTRMLTEDERKLTALRLGKPTTTVYEAPSWPQLKAVLLNPVVVVTDMNVFTPTILALNYPHATAIRIQLLSVPPSLSWAFAMALMYIGMHRRAHAPAALVGAVFTIAGYGTLLATDATYIKTHYTCLFLNTLGGCWGPIILAWTVSNTRSDSARALTGAVISGAGGFGSIVASWSYFPTDAKTGYHIENTLNLSLAVVVTVGIASLWLFEFMANRRASGEEDTFKYIL
ncbi:major facilitator superfamily domain-containing protein [Mycena epipterygia]|nr:major facilitator superfamily domain-containing protein [Mycena epipterygia]